MFLYWQSSQESPEVVYLGDKRGSPVKISHGTSDDIYIGNHRLSPIRKNTSEDIDAMYDDTISSKQQYQHSLSSTLPPRRVIMPSRHISSPYIVNNDTFVQEPDKIKCYQAIVRIANMDEFKQ